MFCLALLWFTLFYNILDDSPCFAMFHLVSQWFALFFTVSQGFTFFHDVFALIHDALPYFVKFKHTIQDSVWIIYPIINLVETIMKRKDVAMPTQQTNTDLFANLVQYNSYIMIWDSTWWPWNLSYSGCSFVSKAFCDNTGYNMMNIQPDANFEC